MHKRFLVEYNVTGICVVDTKKLIKSWRAPWTISQYGDEYRIIDHNSKVTISKEQAEEIIRGIPLFGVKSTLFNRGITWITETSKREQIDELTINSSAMHYSLKALEAAKTLQ